MIYKIKHTLQLYMIRYNKLFLNKKTQKSIQKRNTVFHGKDSDFHLPTCGVLLDPPFLGLSDTLLEVFAPLGCGVHIDRSKLQISPRPFSKYCACSYLNTVISYHFSNWFITFLSLSFHFYQHCKTSVLSNI